MEEGKAVQKKLSVAEAIALIKESNASEDAIRVMEAVVSQNVVALGETEIFTLRNSSGEIKAFRQGLTLSHKNGGLIQPLGSSGPWVVSAQGYEFWQESAGANVIFPQQVLVNQGWMPNPAVIRDPKNGRVLMVYARAVAFRYSSKGILMAVDWTTIYDTPSYRMIDLLAKAKETPQAFKLLPTEMVPPKDEKKTWAKYPFDESTALWIDTSHDAALKWFSTIINREKKSIDFAQTFARRNALKHLSGLQKAPGDTWQMSVLCWKPTKGDMIKWDLSEYVNLQERADQMMGGKRPDNMQIEMQKGSENVSEDETTAGMEASTDIEDQADVIRVDEKTDLMPPREVSKKVEPEKKVETKETKPASKEAKPEGVRVHPAIANLEVTMKAFPEEYEAAIKALKIDPDEIRVTEAQQIMAEINRIVDLKNS